MKYILIFIILVSSDAKPVQKNQGYNLQTKEAARMQLLRNEINKSVSSLHSMSEKSSSKGKFRAGHCLACVLVMKYELKRINVTGNSEEALTWLKKACILFGIETPRVCSGGYRVFKAEASTLFKHAILSPEEWCSLAFPEQCAQIKIGSLTKDWKIPIPREMTTAEKPFEIKHGSAGSIKAKLTVFHLTDVHIDPRYAEGSNALCKEPICCRPEEKQPATNRTIVPGFVKHWAHKAYDIASQFKPKAPKKQKLKGAGRWGDYRQCDLPRWTLEHMLKTVAIRYNNASEKRIDYVFWTGDIPAHDIWAQSRKTQIDYLQYMTGILLRFFPGTLVLPAVGNHDSFPSNNFPSGDTIDDGKWFYNALADAWSPWLPEDALETVRIGAYYTMLVSPGYRIISLNTNFCYTENWWIFLDSKDPAGMLQWFVNLLSMSERKGEKVQVIGHVPPSRSPDCVEVWSKNYMTIIQRFKHVVTGQFFGHTHFDEIQIWYEDDSPFSVAYIAPSMTPYADMNPAFRIYDIDGFHKDSTWAVEDHRTYVLDLDTANRLKDPEWELEYTVRDAYNMSGLEPVNWGKVVREWRRYFEADKQVTKDVVPKSLLNYLKFYSRHPTALKFVDGKPRARKSSANSNIPCESYECLRKIVCDIVKNVDWEMCAKKHFKIKSSQGPTSPVLSDPASTSV